MLASLADVPAGEALRPELLRTSFNPETRQLSISVSQNRGRASHVLRIETPGLREIELGRDVNEPGVIYLPPREGPISLTAPPATSSTAENVFFFNDLIAADEWELALRFADPVHGSWKLNGRFSDQGGALAPQISIPVTALESGENLLHLESPTPVPPARFFQRRVPGAAAFYCAVTVARADWSGRVSLVQVGDGGTVEVAAAEIGKGAEPARSDVEVDVRWSEDRDALARAAVAVGRNLLSAQITRPGSFFHGGFNLVYDTRRKAHRIPHWIWAWGPSIALLLELEKLPAASEAGLSSNFRSAAIAAARKSLEFEVTDPRHPAAGISTVRWEPSRAVPNGWVEYMSTADSLFLAGWGWMPAYEATGDSVFLTRTQKLVAAAERLMNRFPVVPQDWVVERERWTPHTLDESVFGMIGFRELHAATRSAEVAALGRRFLDSHLKHMGRESGLLERAWLRKEDRAIWDPDIKGHAWVVEGYLDAHQLSGDAKYLELARALARQVIECQHEDGSWTYGFKKPQASDPRDDKGTAIWAYMLYTLHRVTGEVAYQESARRALGWCLRHQYRGDDPNLDGGLLHENSMAYVRRRPMTILYSTTFFGLALLEELRLPAP